MAVYGLCVITLHWYTDRRNKERLTLISLYVVVVSAFRPGTRPHCLFSCNLPCSMGKQTYTLRSKARKAYQQLRRYWPLELYPRQANTLGWETWERPRVRNIIWQGKVVQQKPGWQGKTVNLATEVSAKKQLLSHQVWEQMVMLVLVCKMAPDVPLRRPKT